MNMRRQEQANRTLVTLYALFWRIVQALRLIHLPVLQTNSDPSRNYEEMEPKTRAISKSDQSISSLVCPSLEEALLLTD